MRGLVPNRGALVGGTEVRALLGLWAQCRARVMIRYYIRLVSSPHLSKRAHAISPKSALLPEVIVNLNLSFKEFGNTGGQRYGVALIDWG